MLSEDLQGSMTATSQNVDVRILGETFGFVGVLIVSQIVSDWIWIIESFRLSCSTAERLEKMSQFILNQHEDMFGSNFKAFATDNKSSN
jgi:hypothetical protein